jgi:hypothetical protein
MSSRRSSRTGGTRSVARTSSGGTRRTSWGGGQRIGWRGSGQRQWRNYTRGYVNSGGRYRPRSSAYYKHLPSHYYSYQYPYYYYNSSYFPEFARAYLYAGNYAYPYVTTDLWGYLPSPVADYYTIAAPGQQSQDRDVIVSQQGIIIRTDRKDIVNPDFSIEHKNEKGTLYLECRTGKPRIVIDSSSSTPERPVTRIDNVYYQC